MIWDEAGRVGAQGVALEAEPQGGLEVDLAEGHLICGVAEERDDDCWVVVRGGTGWWGGEQIQGDEFASEQPKGGLIRVYATTLGTNLTLTVGQREDWGPRSHPPKVEREGRRDETRLAEGNEAFSHLFAMEKKLWRMLRRYMLSSTRMTRGPSLCL